MAASTYIKKITEKFEKFGFKGQKAGDKASTSLEGLASGSNAKAASQSLSKIKVAVGKYKNYAVAAGVVSGIGAVGWYLLSKDKKSD